MKQALIYVLSVWITTVLGGPLVHLFIQGAVWFIYHSDGAVGTLQWEYGFAFSIPGLVLCLIIVPLFNLLQIRLPIKRIVFSILGLAITFIPLYEMKQGLGNWVLSWTFSYCSVMFAAIWLYKLGDQ
jgi:hypothetical protein